MNQTEKNTRKILKKRGGITLIALVVTIIVLLILAGISIQMLTGDNGILQRATEAKTNTDNAQIKERIQLAYHSALIGGQGSYTKEGLEAELEKEFGEDNYNVDDSDNSQWILTGKENGNEQSITISAGKKEQINKKTITVYHFDNDEILGSFDLYRDDIVEDEFELGERITDVSYDRIWSALISIVGTPSSEMCYFSGSSYTNVLCIDTNIFPSLLVFCGFDDFPTTMYTSGW